MCQTARRFAAFSSPDILAVTRNQNGAWIPHTMTYIAHNMTIATYVQSSVWNRTRRNDIICSLNALYAFQFAHFKFLSSSETLGGSKTCRNSRQWVQLASRPTIESEEGRFPAAFVASSMVPEVPMSLELSASPCGHKFGMLRKNHPSSSCATQVSVKHQDPWSQMWEGSFNCSHVTCWSFWLECHEIFDWIDSTWSNSKKNNSDLAHASTCCELGMCQSLREFVAYLWHSVLAKLCCILPLVTR